MRIPPPLILIFVITAGCDSNRESAREVRQSKLTATVSAIATVAVVGTDTLSDSLQIFELKPEPDGGSVAFLFADPGKGVTRALAIVQVGGNQNAQLIWPDSVASAWWSGPHQLSFIAGTGQGVRVVIDAHAAQLQAVNTGQVGMPPTGQRRPTTGPLTQAQALIDSIRIQPDGRPQQSSLRYQADSALISPNDTIAAVHVSALDSRGGKVNPAWYLIDIPSGQIHPIDSLTGRSLGLAATGGQWGTDGNFYYAKERSIWRVELANKQRD